MSIEIRQVGPADRAVLDHVADEVFDHAIDPALADEFLSDRRHHLFVAIDGGMVVGMITAVEYVHPDKRLQLWINETGVAASHRRRGIGRMLLDAMLAHARTLGCTDAWLGTDLTNEAANALYRSAGGTAAPAILYAWEFAQGDDRPGAR